MRVAVSGASGRIGAALAAALRAEGHEVVRLVRRAASAPDEAGYDPEREFHDPDRVEGCAAVVHLAGAPLGGGRWSASELRAIRHSRYEGTRKLCQNVSQLEELPEVIVSAASMSFYGERGEEELDEASGRGEGGWAEFAEEWEEAAEMVEAVGMRLVVLRLGTVLSRRGGVLSALAEELRAGRGGVLAGGAQWISWVHEEDVVRAVRHAIASPDLQGAVNVVTPRPVRQRELASALADALGVEHGPPVEAATALERLGDRAEELLLASRRGVPRALLADGFAFRWPALPEALRDLVGGA